MRFPGVRGLFRIPAVFILLGFIAAGEALPGGSSGRVELAPREWGTYRARLPGREEDRWTAAWDLERVEEGPPAVYLVRDELRGEFGRRNEIQTRVTEARFLLDEGRIRMIHSLLTVRGINGEVAWILEKDFDYRDRVVRTVAAEPERKRVRRKQFRMGDELVDTKEIVSYLRGFPFPAPEEAEEASGRRIEFKLLNETPSTYSVRAEYRGVEEVETPAGTFLCHRLRLVPDLGILTFIGRLVAPDLYMWFTVAPPHHWVKYEGLEGDLRTPSVVSVLVEFHTAGPVPSAP